MLVLEGSNASSVWEAAWSAVITRGSPRQHVRGDYVESLHSVLSITDPRQRWVVSRQPAINPAFALAEVIWILRGRNDAAFLNSWNSALPSFAGDSDTYHGAYGERVRSRFGFDQLERAATALMGAPEQRQVVLQVWDAQTDFPGPNGTARARDIPCNVVAMLKSVDGRLEWTQVMRSNDLVMGLPYNIVQWTTLQEILAGWMGLDVGSYFHVADSLHVYDRDRGKFGPRTATPESINATTDLRLSKTESDRVLGILEIFMDRIRDTDDEKLILQAVEDASVGAFQDWVNVLSAERLRRINAKSLIPNLLNSIADPQLRTMAANWHSERPSNR